MNYQTTLTTAEDAALSYVASSQQAWIDNVIHERCRVAIEEIVVIAVENFLATGVQIPATKDGIVELAFSMGLVKTAAQRQAEMEAEEAAREAARAQAEAAAEAQAQQGA